MITHLTLKIFLRKSKARHNRQIKVEAEAVIRKTSRPHLIWAPIQSTWSPPGSSSCHCDVTSASFLLSSVASRFLSVASPRQLGSRSPPPATRERTHMLGTWIRGAGTPPRARICITTSARYFRLRAGARALGWGRAYGIHLRQEIYWSIPRDERAGTIARRMCFPKEGSGGLMWVKVAKGFFQNYRQFCIILFAGEDWTGHLGFDTAFGVIIFSWRDVGVE